MICGISYALVYKVPSSRFKLVRDVGGFMMVQVWRWWWQNHYVGDFFWIWRWVSMKKLVINISNRSPTAQTCRRLKLYLTLVSNIDVSTNLFDFRFKKRDYVRSNSSPEWWFHPFVLKNVQLFKNYPFFGYFIHYNISDQISKTSDDKHMFITSGHWCKSRARVRKRCSLSWSSK